MKTLLLILSTSYFAWYLERFEMAAVYPFDPTYSTPAEAGVPKLAEVAFETADGARLVVWSAAATEGQPTVFYLLGNAGTLKDRADRFAQLTERGFGLVAPAYRGSSGSTGAPEEALIVADAASVASEIEGPVVLYGESLGAAVAIRLAANGVGDAVILEAPFTSLAALVSEQFPADDVGTSLTQKWESLVTAPAMRQPLLVIHGKEDRIVPFEMGQSIFAAAGSADKSFLAIPAHGHTSIWSSDLHDALFGFLARDFSD